MVGRAGRVWGRGVAGVGAVVVLGLAAWLTWLLPGPQMAAVLGYGPVDGVVSIQECYEASDAEGYATGTDCTGRYTPGGRTGRPGTSFWTRPPTTTGPVPGWR